MVFNNRLSWSSHVSVIVGRNYSMLRNLWAVIDTTPFAIHMQLAKNYLIPVLFYAFLKGRQDNISHSAYQICSVKFDNLLKISYLILFHKIIITGQPEYLLQRIKFDASFRGMKIIQQRHRTLLSQRQFFTFKS